MNEIIFFEWLKKKKRNWSFRNDERTKQKITSSISLLKKFWKFLFFFVYLIFFGIILFIDCSSNIVGDFLLISVIFYGKISDVNVYNILNSLLSLSFGLCKWSQINWIKIHFFVNFKKYIYKCINQSLKSFPKSISKLINLVAKKINSNYISFQVFKPKHFH